jgi:hypothetical protein
LNLSGLTGELALAATDQKLFFSDISREEAFYGRGRKILTIQLADPFHPIADLVGEKH